MYDRLLTAREVAERLNISRSYVYYLISVGELPGIHIRTAVRIPPRELEEYIAERERLQTMILGPGTNEPQASIADTPATRPEYQATEPSREAAPSRQSGRSTSGHRASSSQIPPLSAGRRKAPGRASAGRGRKSRSKIPAGGRHESPGG